MLTLAHCRAQEATRSPLLGKHTQPEKLCHTHAWEGILHCSAWCVKRQVHTSCMRPHFCAQCRTCPWPPSGHKRGSMNCPEWRKIAPSSSCVQPHGDGILHLLLTGNTHRPCDVQADSGQGAARRALCGQPAPRRHAQQAAHPGLIGKGLVGSFYAARSSLGHTAHRTVEHAPRQFNGEFLAKLG